MLLPDDVIAAEKPCLQQMVEAYQETGGNMVAAMEVPPEKAGSYGVLDIANDMGSIIEARGMVEKPANQCHHATEWLVDPRNAWTGSADAWHAPWLDAAHGALRPT